MYIKAGSCYYAGLRSSTLIDPSRNEVLETSGKHSNKALGIHHRLKEWACLDMTDALFIKKIILYINELLYIIYERAKVHMECYKTWKTFNVGSHESVDVLFSRARREAIERYNEGVRQNREMLKNLTEAVLYFATQELAGFHNKGNYRVLLQSFCKLDSAFDRHLNDRLEATETPDSGGGGGSLVYLQMFKMI